jgi:guanylate kinase
MYDKKANAMGEKQYIESCVNKRREEVRKQAETRFRKIVEDVNQLEETLYADLNKKLSETYMEMVEGLGEGREQEAEYCRW